MTKSLQPSQKIGYALAVLAVVFGAVYVVAEIHLQTHHSPGRNLGPSPISEEGLNGEQLERAKLINEAVGQGFIQQIKDGELWVGPDFQKVTTKQKQEIALVALYFIAAIPTGQTIQTQRVILRDGETGRVIGEMSSAGLEMK